VIVRRGNEFLVLLRCEVDGGYWHVVAGGVDADETYAQAAARELREEIGLVAEPVDVPNGCEPMLNDEHADYRWCIPADAAAILHWPETKELVSEL
jgi:8-oxo-dGTP pyrophosphatase MutT (NUDIX family)